MPPFPPLLLDILTRSKVPVAVVTSSGSLEHANAALRQLLAKQSEDLNHLTSMTQLFAEPERAARLLATSVQHNQANDTLPLVDGTLVRVNAEPLPLPGSEERLVLLSLQAEHASQTTEAQQDSPQWYTTKLVEHAQDMLYRMRLPDGVYEYVSPSCPRILGVTPEQAYANPRLISELMHPDWRDYFSQQWEKLVAGEMPPYYEYLIITPDGQERWLHQRNTLIRDEAGAPVAIEGVVTDISERKRAELALKRQHQRAQQYLDLSGVLFVALDRDGCITLLNKTGCQILGVRQEKALGLCWFDNFVPEGISKQVKEVFDQIVDGSLDNVEQFVNPVVTSSGEERQILWHNALLLDDDGAIAGTLSSGHDITDRELAQKARAQLEERIRKAQRMESLALLAGGIAHDFNNLLMGILGNASLALEHLSPVAPAREYLSSIDVAATRAAELSQQMLAYSGHGRFLVTSVDLNELIQEMAHLLKTSLSKKNLLRFDLAPELPCIEADVTQLRQVVMNLLTNAADAIGERSGVISIATGATQLTGTSALDIDVERDLADGLYISLEVSDTGCGMDRETQKKIFDPFFTTKFTGRGLGLAAVSGIVRGHRGAIKVASKAGEGTSFTVYFPASSEAARAQDEQPAHADEWRASGLVLLVDDEETVRAVTKDMLETMGLTVELARDGREALDKAAQLKQRLRVILLDLMMPHLNGEETFAELKRVCPDVPVVLSSGYSEQEIASRFLDKGLAGFIQKPYRYRSLQQLLHTILEPAAQT